MPHVALALFLKTCHSCPESEKDTLSISLSALVSQQSRKQQLADETLGRDVNGFHGHRRDERKITHHHLSLFPVTIIHPAGYLFYPFFSPILTASNNPGI